ncbi:unnamed protein product [Closterium sp. Yama58-4]|nr:unnamed protein product [Closterium sp. Yama58-4]
MASSTDFRFFLSCDINLPIRFKVESLLGNIDASAGSAGDATSCTREHISSTEAHGGRQPSADDTCLSDPSCQEARALCVECELFIDGVSFGQPVVTGNATWSEADGGKWRWDEWVLLTAKYCDISAYSFIAFTIWDLKCQNRPRVVGGTTLPLFSHTMSAHPPPSPPSTSPRSSSPPLPTDTPLPSVPDDLSSYPGACFGADFSSLPGLPPGSGVSLAAGAQMQHMLKMGRFKARVWLGKKADGGVPCRTPGKVPKEEQGETERLERLVNRYDRGQMARADWLDDLAFAAIDTILEGEEKERSRKRGSMAARLVVEFPTFDHPVAFQELGAAGVAGVGSGGAAGGAISSSAIGTGAVPIGVAPIPASNEVVVLWDPEIEQRVNPAEAKQLKLTRMLTRGNMERDLKPNLAERKAIATILSYPPTQSLSPEDVQLLWRFRFSLTTDRRALTRFLRCVDWSDAEEAREGTELMYAWAPIDTADALELLCPTFSCEEVRAYAVTVLERAGDEELKSYLLQLVHALRYERSDFSNLALFLISRGCHNFELANFLHWYLQVERQDHVFASRYAFVHDHLLATLLELGAEGAEVHAQLMRQCELDSALAGTMQAINAVRGSTARKVEQLRSLLSADTDGSLANFAQPLALPVEPSIRVVGISAEDSSVFKSMLHPLKLAFRREEGGLCRVIFKKGDDLRQDQLVIQMVTLMDKLLKKENLDLCLTPYRVLATAADQGFVEFVSSMPLAQVLAEYRSIERYLHQFHPDAESPYGITPTCLDTFIRSCAGYCVTMYILGVGDRHLDNLLLCTDGRLFHIDFGYIFGRDPKPFPPPMKLCKEMLDAMGGASSPEYVRFRSYCCEAFNILRASSRLFLNLFHLMAHASIPDIASHDPDQLLTKLQQKFRLDLDDEAAVQFIQELINESVSALLPHMVETIHRWAQYWR